MEKDTVLTHHKVSDSIILEDNFKYDVLMTLGLTKLGDYYVGIEFNNLNIAQFAEVSELWNKQKALKIESQLIKKEEYNINFIVAEKMHAQPPSLMTWECLSDDPGMSLIIE